MFTMISVDGIRIKTRIIPRRQLVTAWKTLTSKPFPKVKAFQLGDDDFDYVLRLRWSKEDEERERKEWGRTLSIEGTDAWVFNTDEFADADYVILIRENPYHSVEEVLKHELTHIAKGDL